MNYTKWVEHLSQYKAVKHHYFVIENLCDKSGKFVRIKSFLLNFTPKIECVHINKVHCRDPYLGAQSEYLVNSTEPLGFSTMHCDY